MKKVAASVTPAALASANPRRSAITFMATGDCAGSFFLGIAKNAERDRTAWPKDLFHDYVRCMLRVSDPVKSCLYE